MTAVLPRRWRLPLRRAVVWARHFHPYVWAHAPLCDRYASESLRVGHVFVCRSCAAAAVGAVAALATAVALAPGGAPSSPAVLAVGLATVGAVLAAALHNGRVRSRVGRDLSRAALGACAGVTLAAPALIGWPGLLAWPALAVAAILARRRRAVGHVDRCGGCPHVGGDRACPGFARQVQAVLRLQREL